MRSDLAERGLLFGLSWWILSLSLFAAPATMTARGDAAGHMADLIRLHHDATSPLASILFLDEYPMDRPYDGRSYDPAINEEGTSMSDSGATHY